MEKITTSSSIEKLKKYSAMAGAVLATGAASSQITYVNIDPDTTLSADGHQFMVDLNNDGLDDFVFFLSSYVSSYSGVFGTPGYSYYVNYNFYDRQLNMYVSALNNARFATSMGSLQPFVAGSLIDSGNSWAYYRNIGEFNASSSAVIYSSSGGFFTSYSSPFTSSFQGPLTPGTDAFMGVRIQDAAANTHYGWIRVQFNASGDEFTIKDYAFEAVPDSSIEAGDSASFALSLIELENKVWVKNAFDHLEVLNLGGYTNGQIALLNMAGQQVAMQPLTGTRTEVTIQGIATGVYIADIRFNEGTIRRKVYVK